MSSRGQQLTRASKIESLSGFFFKSNLGKKARYESVIENEDRPIENS